MKQIILGACGCLLIIYAMYANQNFADEAVRKSELNLALSHGINQTLEMHRESEFESEEDMEMYFMKLFKSQITSDGILKVNVITSNCRYGILDIEAVEYFQASDQKERKITVRKCGIIDEQKS